MAWKELTTASNTGHRAFDRGSGVFLILPARSSFIVCVLSETLELTIDITLREFKSASVSLCYRRLGRCRKRTPFGPSHSGRRRSIHLCSAALAVIDPVRSWTTMLQVSRAMTAIYHIRFCFAYRKWLRP